MGERIWRMPPPPPACVISVFDGEGNEWQRVDDAGQRWRDQYGTTVWDALVFDCGPIREGVRAS